VEALFLIAVTRAAFAITDGRSRFAVVAGVEVEIGLFVVGALGLVILRVALAIVSVSQSAQLSAGVVAEIRSDLASAYLDASWSSQHGERGGRLQELLTTFANQGAALVNSVAQGVVAGFTLVALLIVAVIVDPLSSMVVIFAVLILAMILRPLRAAVKRQAGRTASEGMVLATSLSEASQLGMEMHVFRVQGAIKFQVVDLIRRTEAVNERLQRLKGLVPAVYSGLAYVALIAALGAVSAVESANLRTVGAVMLVMLRSLSYGQALQSHAATISSSIPFLGTLQSELRRYQAARSEDSGEPIERVGTLRLDDVSFEYESDTPVLHHVDGEIPPREIVGIVGPSGSGKSTLVQLLLGLRSPTSGTVMADGRDISGLGRTAWARRVTFVPQEAHLIAGTVGDNIRFFREGVNDEQVEQAARLAQLHDDIEGFRDGYDHQVGEQGSHLSGGQKQRLIIARALVESPDVIILDEPTSALDVRSESLIRETLRDLASKMTVIIIAHRLSTLDICDRIMVIQDGRLVAFESPAELSVSNEFFRESLKLSGLQ
jgi:ABC-type multidrug transport system fused ATPase/permease subunit